MFKICQQSKNQKLCVVYSTDLTSILLVVYFNWNTRVLPFKAVMNEKTSMIFSWIMGYSRDEICGSLLTGGKFNLQCQASKTQLDFFLTNEIKPNQILKLTFHFHLSTNLKFKMILFHLDIMFFRKNTDTFFFGMWSFLATYPSSKSLAVIFLKIYLFRDQ